jgi:hypothetical protein
MPSKALNEFLKQGDEAGALMAQAKQLLTLRRAMEAVVPPALRPVWQLANFKQGNAILFAANNAVAARLRLLAPALLQACLDRGAAIKDLKVEVQPAAFTPKTQPLKRAHLSRAARDSLQRLERKLGEGELREHVRALVERHSEKKKD